MTAHTGAREAPAACQGLCVSLSGAAEICMKATKFEYLVARAPINNQ